MSENLQQQTDEKMRLRQEILEKEEELECMESQFSTQCDISEVLQKCLSFVEHKTVFLHFELWERVK